MNNKLSYRQKQHAERSFTQEESAPEKEFIPLSEERKAQFEEGVVLFIDKPLHWTSFDVVKKVRSILRIKKVGHAGTLDPLATGLLIICTGKYTKKINEYMAKEKEYVGSFTIGAVTKSYDLETEPEEFKEIAGITERSIRAATLGFMGEIKQVPPMYSALKKKGIPLYELARKGTQLELEPRTVFIKSFEITAVNLPEVDFKIVCSTGTYIRSIAHDFGKILGCGAYLSKLRRTRIGEFTSKEAVSVDGFL